MRVRRAGERIGEDARERLVGRLRQIARDLLFDGAALLRPLRLRVDDVVHARGVDAQGNLEIGGGNLREVLRDRLLRVGVAVAAQLREDGRRLVRVDALAAAERHVLLGVRHPREAVGRLVRADEIVIVDARDRSERIADDHDAQAVVERRSRHVPRCGRPGLRRDGTGHDEPCAEG